MKPNVTLKSVATFLIATAACSKPLPNSVVNSYASQPFDTWPDAAIQVCWANSNPAAPAPTRIKQHISTEFRDAGVRIFGWGACAGDEPNVLRMSWVKDGDRSEANIGFSPSRSQHELKLNIAAHTCNANFLTSNCVVNVAMHEFGHVVGLHHEFNRFDAKYDTEMAACRKGLVKRLGAQAMVVFDGEPVPTLQIGDVDELSVMNYCRIHEANQKKMRCSH